MEMEVQLKNEHQRTWFAKFNYLETSDSSKSRNLSPAKYFFSKFAKLKSRENKW